MIQSRDMGAQDPLLSFPCNKRKTNKCTNQIHLQTNNTSHNLLPVKMQCVKYGRMNLRHDLSTQLR